jgi:ABC-type thiamine transport system substrate-binding protein
VYYVANKPLFNKEAFLEHAKKNIEKNKPAPVSFKDRTCNYGQGTLAYVYGQGNCAPARYTLKDMLKKEPLETIVTDKDGHILGKEELQDILANSTSDD